MRISYHKGEQGGWTTETLDETKFLVLRGKEHGASDGYCLIAPSTALEAVQTIEQVRRKTWFSAELLAGLVHAIFNGLETHAIYPLRAGETWRRVGEKWRRGVTYTFCDGPSPDANKRTFEVTLYAVLAFVGDLDGNTEVEEEETYYEVDYFDDNGYVFSFFYEPEDFEKFFVEPKIWRPYDGPVYESVETGELFDLANRVDRSEDCHDASDPVKYYIHEFCAGLADADSRWGLQSIVNRSLQDEE